MNWRIELAAPLAMVLVGIAFWTTIAGRHAAPKTTGPAKTAATSVASDRTIHDELARRDLSRLAAILPFKPLLPERLPSGFSYYQVSYAPGAPQGFDVFLVGPDLAVGSRGLHMHQAAGRPATAETQGKGNPLDVYRGVVRPVTLLNGMWYAMQNKDNPYPNGSPYGGGIGGPDAWTYMAQRGDVLIEVDGLTSQEVLRDFAGSLNRLVESWSTDLR